MSDRHIERYASGMPFPEGPVFGPDGMLYVCCRRHGWIAKVREDRSVLRLAETGGKPQALALTPDGKMMYLADAIRKQILTMGIDGRLDVVIDDPRLIGPNDLTFGPRSGDLFFTDPGNEWGAYIGSVYRWSPRDRKLILLADKVGFPNGLEITRDEKRLFVAESLTDKLLSIDLQRPGCAELAYQLPPGAIPDGMEWLPGGGKLAIAEHGAGALDIVDTIHWTHARIPLPGKASPTNLTVRGDAMYVTDDGAEGLLRVPLSIVR